MDRREFLKKIILTAGGIAVVNTGLVACNQKEEKVGEAPKAENKTAPANNEPSKPAAEPAMPEPTAANSEDQLQDKPEDRKTIPCTKCGQCLRACPMGIGITGIFFAYNQYVQTGDLKAAQEALNNNVTAHGLKLPNECTECGRCESVCRHHIKIVTELKKVSRILA